MQRLGCSMKRIVLFMIGSVLVGSVFSVSAKAQQIEMRYLNSFLGKPYEKIFDAPPYVGSIARDSGDWVIQFYERSGGEWTLHHTKRIQMVENRGLLSCTANESLLVLTLNLPHQSVGYQAIDIASDSNNYDLVEIPPVERERDGGIEYVEPRIVRVRMSGRTVYSLCEDRRLRVTRYNADLTRISHQEIALSTAIGMRDFDLIGEDEIVFTGIPMNTANNPELDRFQGVGFARLIDGGGLEYDERRWFYQAPQNPGNPFRFSPESVDVCGSTVFVSRRIRNDDFPLDIVDYEILVVDWSDRDNPKTDRVISDLGVLWSFAPRVSFNQNSMAVGVYSPTSSNVFLFNNNGESWIQAHVFDNKYPPSVFNDSTVIFDYRNKLYAYDITDPLAPVSIDPPIDESSTVFSIALAGRYAYLLLQDPGIRNGDCSQWMVFDVSDPNNPLVVKRETFDSPMDNLYIRDSVLVMANTLDATCKMYALHDDGSLGEEIPLPEYSPKESIDRIYAPFWNSHLIAFPYLQYKSGMEPIYLNTEEVVRVYQWNGNRIGELLSVLVLPDNTILQNLWVEDCLVVYSYKELEEIPFIPDNRQNVFDIYSYQTPESPELIAEYPIPSVAPSKRERTGGIGSYNSHYKIVVYTSTLQSGLIDFTDPANPRHFDFFLPPAKNFKWNGDRLVFQTDSELVFYRLNESYDLEEIGRMSDLPTSPAFNPVFTQDRIYANRYSMGVEIYGVNEINTLIREWNRF